MPPAQHTPLRYPGGKRRLAQTVMRLLDANGLRDIEYIEPYAGSAAIALELLFHEYAARIHINDLSRPIFAFWRSVLTDPDAMCRRIERVRVTMTEWRRQRAVYEQRDSADLGDLGFATLFLNRTNRSGIIGGGVIGGKTQSSEWGVDARFTPVTKREVIRRIQKIGRYAGRINLYQRDALDFTKEIGPKARSNAFFFYDPPYIEKSRLLYLNTYRLSDHERLAQAVIRLKQPWVVTYDMAALKLRSYVPFRRLVYALNYSAAERYAGREVMFISHQLQLPHATRLMGRRMELIRRHTRLTA